MAYHLCVFAIHPNLVCTKKEDALAGVLSVSYLFLLCVFNQAVAAVFSLVDHCERTVVVFVAEGKERMLQQVHLQDGFFSCHRLHVRYGRRDGQCPPRALRVQRR